jgi:putative transposase
MWTETAREQYRRAELRCASDLTDAEWALISPRLPGQKALERPCVVALRGVVDALLYISRMACPWRLSPRDFPKPSTVQRYFYAWQAEGLWERGQFPIGPTGPLGSYIPWSGGNRGSSVRFDRPTSTKPENRR